MPVVRRARRPAARAWPVRIAQALGLCGMLAAGVAPAGAQQQFVTTKGDLKKESWWQIADFHPFTTEVRGIPVGQIKSSWCKATEFRRDLIAKALLDQDGVDGMTAYKLSFAVEGRFDGSATRQVALVGVYQECSGQKGRFLLILDQPAKGQSPKVRFVDAERTAHQFGALSVAGNSIVLSSCMECDIGGILKWNAQKRRFAWVPTKGDD
jgi:hypothetical protein